MLLLALGIVVFFVLYQRRIINHELEIKEINERKQLELLQASIQSEEEERQRIAGELHDDVGATLSSIRLFLHKADTNAELLVESRQLLDLSIQKVRDISHKLQPDTLYRLGLQTSLEAFCETISKSGSISVRYVAGYRLPRLQDNVELSVYRIVQELVNNIVKHAHATVVTIETKIDTGELVLTMVHDGNGMTNEVFEERTYKKGAIGLKNIVNRLNSIKGAIDFSKAANNYLITLQIPYTPKE